MSEQSTDEQLRERLAAMTTAYERTNAMRHDQKLQLAAADAIREWWQRRPVKACWDGVGVEWMCEGNDRFYAYDATRKDGEPKPQMSEKEWVDAYVDPDAPKPCETCGAVGDGVCHCIGTRTVTP